MTYLLNYDLDRPGQNYAGLAAALQQAGAVRILLSTWVLSTNESAMQVRERYWRYMDNTDRLFVCHVNSDWAAYNLMNKDAALRLLPA